MCRMKVGVGALGLGVGVWLCTAVLGGFAFVCACGAGFSEVWCSCDVSREGDCSPSFSCAVGGRSVYLGVEVCGLCPMLKSYVGLFFPVSSVLSFCSRCCC